MKINTLDAFTRQESRRVAFFKAEIIKRKEQHKEEILRLKNLLKVSQNNLKLK